MENFNLESLELKELNKKELIEVEGGSLLLFGLGILVGLAWAWMLR